MNRLDVMWCLLRAECPPDLPDRFVARLQEHLPAGLPVAFGNVEPLGNKVADVGLDGFAQAWSASSEMMFWRAKKPFGSGSTVRLGGLAEESDRVMGTIKMSVASDVVADDASRDAFRRFFAAVASDAGAFFGHVGVARQGSWIGSSLEAKLTNPGVAFGGEFHGLPVGDLWLAYFGDRYVPLVEDHLDLVSSGVGATFEIEGAWEGEERKPEARLVGRVPDELLLWAKDILKRPTRDELRQGGGLIAAELIPEGLR